MRATLTPAERELIETTVASAERRTGAEFVVIIANRSGEYFRAAEAFGTVVSLVVTVAVSLALPVTTVSGSWFEVRPAPLGLFGTLALFVVTGGVASWLGSRSPRVLRQLTPGREMLKNVKRRGAECFVNFRVHCVGGRAGVLVYVSLVERAVWVVADDVVAEKLSPGSDLWERVSARITEGYGKGEGAAGIAAGLEMAAEGLREVLPPVAGANELSNVVRLLND